MLLLKRSKLNAAQKGKPAINWILEGKGKAPYDWYFDLEIRIHFAAIIHQIKKKHRVYRIIIRDSKGAECRALTVGCPQPRWNVPLKLFYESYPHGESLTIEVLEENCFDDPGPSNGKVVVGRAVVTVPRIINTSEKKMVELVKLGFGKCGWDTKTVKGYLNLELRVSIGHELKNLGLKLCVD